MQLSQDIVPALGIDVPAEETSPPYITFDDKIFKRQTEIFGPNSTSKILRQYDDENGGHSSFR